ncbi:response regulator [Flavobacterium sp. LHD-85]|uniref:response regulator n=1 Tax=Flavobacterium sp. LHD-85 TaxID=3071410 RepID=UPI0027DF50EC|nr:response regulator [Flavobacterium sp. LHD-85]MDQ6531947.1 response regulator [Flavobacterium sp. LHD-85]
MSIRLYSNFHRVMIIDNDQIDRFILKHLISKNKFSDIILEYDDANKALDYLIENQNHLFLLPQIIFIDIRMPGMYCFEFMKEYDKLSSILKSTSKVFITSSIGISSIDRSKLDGKNIGSFIDKPVTQDYLEVIKSLFC